MINNIFNIPTDSDTVESLVDKIEYELHLLSEIETNIKALNPEDKEEEAWLNLDKVNTEFRIANLEDKLETLRCNPR